MIRMEHPELPKSTEDKPVQLWAKKKDVEVRRDNSSPSLPFSRN